PRWRPGVGAPATRGWMTGGGRKRWPSSRRSPVAARVAQAQGGTRLSHPLVPGNGSGAQEERIMAPTPVLVVEDDPTLARAIARNLSARGYVPRSATTVVDAMAAIAEAGPP